MQTFEDYSHTFPNQEINLFLGGGDVSKGTVTWNPPASEEEITHFFGENGWHIPADLKEFYLLHNGGVLFKHPYYGGGTRLLSLNEIKKYWMKLIIYPRIGIRLLGQITLLEAYALILKDANLSSIPICFSWTL
nr:SMI1/KNR4 family protein [Paenibacillus apiarius]